jgi:hypothetical protein
MENCITAEQLDIMRHTRRNRRFNGETPEIVALVAKALGGDAPPHHGRCDLIQAADYCPGLSGCFLVKRIKAVESVATGQIIYVAECLSYGEFSIEQDKFIWRVFKPTTQD